MSLGRLTAVRVAGELRLGLQWDDGSSGEVDLRDVVAGRAALRPLAQGDGFATVRVSDDGWSLEWPDSGIDFGAQQLRRWAQEQSGEAMPLAAFLCWLQRHKLSPEQAARALGLAPHDVDRFLSGEAAIPKTIMLATEGYDGRQAA